MSQNPSEFWTNDTSVFFTSFWGWSPETWGEIGWTGTRGEGRRRNLSRDLTDPFIAVIYVTGTPHNDEELHGKIAGFYLISHEAGDRDEFTHPIHHELEPEKWRNSLRAIRAFSYLPEHRLTVSDLDPDLLDRARSVAAMGEVLTDPRQIELLRTTPWVEVDVYLPASKAVEMEEELAPIEGFNRAGPANRDGYVVSSSAQRLKRQLYILRLSGDADAYLGKSSKGRHIYKIGLSASPELRKQSLQNGMPNGAFSWMIHRTSGTGGRAASFSFEAAVAGEYAMKRQLAKCAVWLGGEFYLAKATDIETAWQLGCAAAQSFGNA